eukprot:PhM_4_TR4551/c0_g1_i1/m.51213
MSNKNQLLLLLVLVVVVVVVIGGASAADEQTNSLYGDASSPPWSFSDSQEAWGRSYPTCLGSLQSPVALPTHSSISEGQHAFLSFLASNAKSKGYSKTTEFVKIHAANTDTITMRNVTNVGIHMFSSVLPTYYRLSHIRFYSPAMHTVATPTATTTTTTATATTTDVRHDVEIVFQFDPLDDEAETNNNTNKKPASGPVMLSFLIADSSSLIATTTSGGASAVSSSSVEDGPGTRYNALPTTGGYTISELENGINTDLQGYLNGDQVIPFFSRKSLDRVYLDDVVMYPGSVPHPPCDETVTWVVLRSPIYASKAQIDLLVQSAREGKPPAETSIAATTTFGLPTAASKQGVANSAMLARLPGSTIVTALSEDEALTSGSSTSTSSTAAFSRATQPLHGRSMVKRSFKST